MNIVLFNLICIKKNPLSYSFISFIYVYTNVTYQYLDIPGKTVLAEVDTSNLTSFKQCASSSVISNDIKYR